MGKIVTYQGKAGRYFVSDSAGKRHYFPRGEPTLVSDDVAALVPKGNSDLVVEDDKAKAGDAGGEKDKETESAGGTAKQQSGSSEEKK